ncbi:hypothetical protein QNI16_20570 [Cytophagaceae bacterium YF14B1]|uniref:Thioredoxin n=1 Tax=Xanthocytophaga flava TaxID=3048013 RepID=A0AAE3QT47_9BACT|nr:hypothetical protein [Xanthocytophaga flavus]MDJ1482908.1 hypothetical protein [Xanthocytophaga flavus]
MLDTNFYPKNCIDLKNCETIDDLPALKECFVVLLWCQWYGLDHTIRGMIVNYFKQYSHILFGFRSYSDDKEIPLFASFLDPKKVPGSPACLIFYNGILQSNIQGFLLPKEFEQLINKY